MACSAYNYFYHQCTYYVVGNNCMDFIRILAKMRCSFMKYRIFLPYI